MTQITTEHVEWAVVDRLSRMLEEPPPTSYNVSQSYALFTAILCWSLQRIRIRAHEIATPDDRTAHKLFGTLLTAAIKDDPWRVHVMPTTRTAKIGSQVIVVPAPTNFRTRTAGQFLVNLRDATVHGDARRVIPFNVPIGGERLLVGFTFKCDEPGGNRPKTWEGEITLLESDLRRIGGALAKLYCDALGRSEAHRGDNQFGSDAARSVREVAA
jgi:hypothetical protein